MASSPIPGCPPSKGEIEKYMTQKNAWNFLPFIGPAIAGVALKPPANKAQEELTNDNAQLQVATDNLLTKITQVVTENRILIDQSETILKKYVDINVMLAEQKASNGITMNTVRIGALAVVVLMIIFFGL